MHKRTITYTYLNDEDQEVTESGVFYFGLSKREVAELDLVKGEASFEAWFQKAVAANDRKGLYEFFKGVVLQAYGIREDAGKVFKKTPEIREQFSSSAAYEALFDEFLASDNAMMEFFKGCLPKDFSDEWDKAVTEARGQLGAAEPAATT